MKILMASDHGGYELKEGLAEYLKKEGHEVIDLGTNSTKSVDYPIYGEKIGKEIAANHGDFGIAICGTGIGISIAANKVKGIRAALVYDENTAHLAKEHNNANIIALGGRTTTLEEAKKIVQAYLDAHFELRHQKRLDLIKEMEEKK